MTSKKALKPAVAVFATGALCATMAIAPFSSAVPQAQANTYSNLVNAQNKKLPALSVKPSCVHSFPV